MGATSVRRSAAASVLIVTAAVFALTVAASWLPGVEGDSGLSDLIWFCSFLTFPLVGFLILWHRADNLVGWIFLAVGLFQVAAGLAGAVSELALSREPGSVNGALFLVLNNVCFAVAWVLATTFPLLLYPDGRLPSRRWRWVVYATTAGLVVAVVAMLVKPGRIESDNPVVNPLGIAALRGLPERVLDLTVIVLLGVSLIGLVSLVVRWRRGSADDRRQLAWLALAAVLMVVVTVAGFVASPWTPDWVGTVEEAFTVAALPVATGVAVLRSRLFDVQSVLDRALVYVVLTGIVVATYAAAVAIATSLMGSDAGRGASLLAAAVVAVSLSPVKERLHRGIERFLYGDRSRPYAVLSGLAAKLGSTSGSDDLLTTVTASIAESLRVPYVKVAMGKEVPVPDGAVAIPLVSHGRSEGLLLVGQRSGGRDFDAREMKLLTDLASQVAVEARGMRLAVDLQESRESIVRAREEERLRVRRDLHDGVGPTLAAAGLQVDALRDKWQVNDPTVAALLGQIKSEISQCVLDIRRVVDGLRPPALDDLGLAGVVREHAASLTAAGLSVEVDCPPDLEVASAAVEVAAYRIVTEAMTNVVRHAAAAHCAVSLECAGGWLRLDVSDDGIGLMDSHRDGIGLSSMRERAAELGGSVAVEGRSGSGTRVTANLPVPTLGSGMSAERDLVSP